MSIRHKLEAWIVRRILLRHYGRMRLLDGTMAAHQSSGFHRWCYGPGYQIFIEGQPEGATNGQE